MVLARNHSSRFDWNCLFRMGGLVGFGCGSSVEACNLASNYLSGACGARSGMSSCLVSKRAEISCSGNNID